MQAKLLTLCMALCAVCITATSQNVPDYVPTEGLVAWYPLNGDVLDIGPTGMNGVNYGAQCDENRNQIPCEAMSFTAGDYLSIAADSSFTSQEGTMTGWVKLNSYASQSGASGYNHFFNRWAVSSHEFVFAANIDGLYMYVENELFQSDTLPTLNEWHHLAFSYSSINGMAKIYIDGQNVAEFEGVDTLTPTNHPLHIGGNPLVPAYNSVDGSMDDVGFWERTLELSEITAIYNAQLPVLGCTDSIACNFNEEANNEDGSCVYPLFGEDCETGGAACGEGTIWDVNIQACVVPEFCQEDLDGDGVIGVNDLMQLLSVYATDCEAEDVDPELDEFTCGGPLNYQGYDYATVQIGEQCWFAENLRNQKYANGDLIPDNLDDVQWSSTDFGATSIYGEDSSDCYGPCDEIENLDWHGRLYNFEAIQDPRGLCPSGWSPPSETDVLDLIGYYGGVNLAGPDLAAEGAWGVGTGESGLDVVPQGWRNPSGYFSLSGDFYLWTSTEGLPNESSFLRVAYQGSILVDQISQWFGMSARCLKDTEE
jgi:uncharacterized protein (TIGR02145 family)